MEIKDTILRIQIFLTDTFSGIDKWFEKDAALRSYKPSNGGWSIVEILEHIGLTNHFLLILIDKGAKKALQNVNKVDLQKELKQQQFNWEKLSEVGLHNSFPWIRPDHMEPVGKPLVEVRVQLKEQVQRCLNYLESLSNGEGVLYKTTMSVNSLGKLNVYEYIYFLAQHGLRHIMQMEKVEAEYNLVTK